MYFGKPLLSHHPGPQIAFGVSFSLRALIVEQEWTMPGVQFVVVSAVRKLYFFLDVQLAAVRTF